MLSPSKSRNRRILYIQFTNPAAYPPLEHSSQILADLDWQVLFLGTDALGANSLTFPPHPTIEVRQLPFRAPGWRQKVGFLWYIIWVFAHVMRWRPGWVYASDLFACPVGLLLTFLPGMQVIYHEHDSPADGAPSRLIRWLKWTRKWLARRAQLCILPNGQRADRFERELTTPRPPMVVWNCPRKNDVIRCQSKPDVEEMWVLYIGSIVPSRLPLSVVKALALLPVTVRLRLVGYETVGAQGYIERLIHYAAQLGVSEKVDYVGAVPRRQLAKIATTCQVGLSLFPLDGSDYNEQTMIGASNKPFEYLACGIPLLVSEMKPWLDNFVKPGYGLACASDSATSIASALQWYWDHPDERDAMGLSGRERILAEWNYETQFDPVLHMIQGSA